MNHTASPRPNFWRSKRLLVTGPNGFKGGWLALEIAKARVDLVVNPKWHFAETVQRTMAWYRAQQQSAGARNLCEAEIAQYEAAQ